MKFTLTIDLKAVRGKGNCHYGTLFLEQNEMQAYWVSALDRHEHGQLNDCEVQDYIDQLTCRGFTRVTVEDIACNRARPCRYFIVLTSDQDWDIEEILVVNRFQDHPDLMLLVRELNIVKLSHHLLVTKWDDMKKWTNNRGNLQLNHGSNHLDINDHSKVTGMNLARNHVRPRELKPGINGDATTEQSLVKAQIIVTRIFDLIAGKFSRTRVYTSLSRGLWFAIPNMIEMGMNPDLFRAESGAYIYSGLLPERTNGVHTAQCAFHFDSHNDHREEGGMNDNICFSQMIELKFPNRSRPVMGRAALNQFMKECNGKSIERYSRTLDLCSSVRSFMTSHGVGCQDSNTNIDWTSILDEVREVAKSNGEDYATLPANANKDCHYSWFVHVIFEEVIPVYGWDIYVLCEVIYCMSLTPSAIGWRTGIRYALMARCNGDNIYENFIHEMVAKEGAVANCFGKKPRHQVHSGALITMFQAMTSMHNELHLFAYACHPQAESRKLYEDMAAHESKKTSAGRLPGLRNVSDLTAYDIVNVATKAGVVTNLTHVKNITVARNTETARRLKDYGITTDAHLREVVIILSAELGIEDYQIVENLICETLRDKYGKGGQYLGVDTIGVEQPLYQFVEDVLYSIGRDGNVEEINLDEVRRKNPPKGYNPRLKWWDMDINNPGFSLGDDYDYVLTKKSKVLRRYLDSIK